MDDAGTPDESGTVRALLKGTRRLGHRRKRFPSVRWSDSGILGGDLSPEMRKGIR